MVADTTDTLRIEDVRISINVFGNTTAICQALGLDIERAACDREDPGYWEQVWAEGWKPKLRGKVADLGEERGDPEWAMLLRSDFCEVWFDIAEAIRIRSRISHLRAALDLVYGLRDKGISLAGESGSLVRVNQTMFGPSVPDVADAFRACGLVGEPTGTARGGVPLWWEPPAVSPGS
jgi:hypothetical protein